MLATEWINIASLPILSAFLLFPSAKINASWLLSKQVGCSMHHSRQDSNLQRTIHFSGVRVSRATGTQTSARQSCKHTRVLSGRLHGEVGAGSREDTEMAGPAWPASEDNSSKLHSHQKMLHLQIKFWLPPNAPACSLWINCSSFCSKAARKGAL